MKNIIKINENDNVVVALTDLNKSDVIKVDGKEITVTEPVKRGHKVAITNIKEGENIVKYGFYIGHAIKDIEVGQWIHTHNIKTNLSGIKEYVYNKKKFENNFEDKKLTFKGYKRENGTVGI